MAMLQNITSNDKYRPGRYVIGLFLPLPVHKLVPLTQYQTLQQYRAVCSTTELPDGDGS
jgi:hypothetical protein